jgi:hypothetical protein
VNTDDFETHIGGLIAGFMRDKVLREPGQVSVKRMLELSVEARNEVAATMHPSKLLPSKNDVRENRQAGEIHDALERKGFAATHDSPKWHAGEFDWRKYAGSGEGNSAYGAGLYLSTADGIHRRYKNMFTGEVKRGGGKLGEWADRVDELKSVLRWHEGRKDRDLQRVREAVLLADRLNGHEESMQKYPHAVEHVVRVDNGFAPSSHSRRYTYHPTAEDAQLAAAFSEADTAKVLDSNKDPRKLGPWKEGRQEVEDQMPYVLRDPDVMGNNLNATVLKNSESGRFFFSEFMGEDSTEGPLPSSFNDRYGYATLAEATDALKQA